MQIVLILEESVFWSSFKTTLEFQDMATGLNMKNK